MTAYRSTTHQERYFHLAASPLVGLPFTNVTVFMREEVPGSNMWGLSLAFCSVQDQFCRRTGRQVARRKYFKDSPEKRALKSTLFIDGTEKNNYIEAAMNAATQHVMKLVAKANRQG